MSPKLSLAMLTLMVSAIAAAANATTNPPAAFDQLKTLVGEWEGQNSAGAVKATYTLASGGTVLMERLKSANEPEMITMYSADGDHIVVTHYCSAGNQPQMTSNTLLGKPQKFSFSLVRVTGMKTEAEGHMVGLVLSIVDKDHFTQEWKYQANGKVSADLFQLKRKLEPPASVVAPSS